MSGYCPSCGSELSGDEEFCPGCGSELGGSAAGDGNVVVNVEQSADQSSASSAAATADAGGAGSEPAETRDDDGDPLGAVVGLVLTVGVMGMLVAWLTASSNGLPWWTLFVEPPYALPTWLVLLVFGGVAMVAARRSDAVGA
jgi:RNA polymerase subunit RPABC4/transcription elongation factor Spt4